MLTLFFSLYHVLSLMVITATLELIHLVSTPRVDISARRYPSSTAMFPSGFLNTSRLESTIVLPSSEGVTS